MKAELAKLEDQCRQEMEKHKQQLDREYETLLTQFSKELEKLQLKHQVLKTVFFKGGEFAIIKLLPIFFLTTVS